MRWTLRPEVLDTLRRLFHIDSKDLEWVNGSLICKDAEIKSSTLILPGCMIVGEVEIGGNNVIGPYTVIGAPPQHRDFYSSKLPETGKIVIGNNNIIREFVTVHLPTEGETVIGDNCFLLAYVHLGHDVILGNNVTLSNNTQIGGHSTIKDNVITGLNTCIHQYTTLGAYSMIGMGSIVVKDVPPFVVYKNFICYKINEVGLERAGFNTSEIEEIKKYYKEFLDIDKITSLRVKKHLIDFLNTRNSNRKIAEVDIS
ncbi:Acyl-(acyl carrier protein)--UDP-N-acetylglucosamine O-acyltransferase [Archaeoglobus sulfaticallidus PM70-1]|uniref:Acyl-(Acyl carrier protein)--UDP-N-acetylglucosamine O-acyltransferase n=1 Tax=Archaeoglobus sulfaticallidus PM70-1 TaxID=387631 RepID=N0BIW5_9EURY|nr:acyl-ACP-UDP-N-acetylglucosamine O-acyltransferase [Archaeoglobus sulfaticallidus]AGK60085.1 Acyl-(acyl carrier protein)--UDP-N-acetylglucosamine O-acyltransferase [Archaeoglobus sulfaticallidus PM70-1]